MKPATCPITAARVLCTALFGAALVLGGCSQGLDKIDAKIARILQDRTRTLDGGTIAPRIAAARRTEPETEPPYDSSDRLNPEPASTNPPAGELAFERAGPDRDVAETLAQLQRLDEPGRGALELDLPATFRQTHVSAREFLDAEEEYILAAIRLLIEQHRWSPRLFNDTSAGFTSSQTDGSTDSALRVINELRVTQRLPYGGDVAARWIVDATEDLRSSTTGQYTQSSSLVLDADIPLLRGAGPIAREELIQRSRDLVYASRSFERFRRSLLVSIAADYFDLLQQQRSIENQRSSIEGREEVVRRQQALFEAGRIPQFDVNIARNSLFDAQQTLSNLLESYKFSLDRFKVRLGIDVTEPVVILPFELEVPEPEASVEHATRAALRYRLDLQNRRDFIDDARRAVANARNQLLPDLDLDASIALRTDDDATEGGVVYELDDVEYAAGITFGLPLDREIERLNLRSQTIGLRRSVRGFEEFKDNVILEARQRLREIPLARFNLDLAEQRVRINERRKIEQTIKEDEVTTQERIDTANELLDAQNARDQARTDLRNAVLDYLLATGQLRVQRDGTFEQLPGMGVQAEPEFPETDGPMQ